MTPGSSDHVVLLDLDGVLVDSRVAFSGSVNHALTTQGLRARRESELYQFIGPPLAATFANLIAEPVDSSAVAACVESYRSRYAEVSSTETKVVAGIEDALAGLTPSRRLAVATSKPRALAEPLLTALGLRDYFDVVVGPDLAALAESKSHTIGVALRALGATRGAMVGDRAVDIVGAHDQGLVGIGVSWGIGDRAELESAGADIIVSDPAKLSDALRESLDGA